MAAGWSEVAVWMPGVAIPIVKPGVVIGGFNVVGRRPLVGERRSAAWPPGVDATMVGMSIEVGAPAPTNPFVVFAFFSSFAL